MTRRPTTSTTTRSSTQSSAPSGCSTSSTAKGTVYYMRGIAGHPADTDRDIGFKNVLKDYPDIKVLPSADGVVTGWDPAQATQAHERVHPRAVTYDKIDGIWTSGIDSEVVDAIKAAKKPYVPIVGADRRRLRRRSCWTRPATRASKGAAVTNTAAVGGAGVALALKLLNGETVTDRPVRDPSRTPSSSSRSLADNLTDAGKPRLELLAVGRGPHPTLAARPRDPGLDDYTPEQAVACKGPGE